MNAILALEDGTWYRGVAAGATGEAHGEVDFNTSMTGYQEVLTDPSYAGQIVTMTAPQIGNYGVASGDEESQAPQVAGFIMREASTVDRASWPSPIPPSSPTTSSVTTSWPSSMTRALTRAALGRRDAT
jgi:carbamoyl-phosphate synthase small subunit